MAGRAAQGEAFCRSGRVSGHCVDLRPGGRGANAERRQDRLRPALRSPPCGSLENQRTAIPDYDHAPIQSSPGIKGYFARQPAGCQRWRRCCGATKAARHPGAAANLAGRWRAVSEDHRYPATARECAELIPASRRDGRRLQRVRLPCRHDFRKALPPSVQPRVSGCTELPGMHHFLVNESKSDMGRLEGFNGVLHVRNVRLR